MERDDILKKARSQGGEPGERERQTPGNSFGTGLMPLPCAAPAANLTFYFPG